MKTYIEPIAKFVKLDMTDIIATSGGQGETGAEGDDIPMN